MYKIVKDTINNSPYSRVIISKTCPLHSHAFFEFAVCTKGSYTNTINNTPYELSAGNIVLLRPQDEHIFTTTKPHTHRDIYVSIEKMQSICNLIDKSLYNEIIQNPLKIFFNISTYDLHQLESKLDMINNEKEDNILNQTAHTNIIIEIITLWYQNKSRKTSNYPLWLSTLLQQLNREEFLLKNINDIVSTVNYSHGYICRMFKQYLGISLKEYVSNLKFKYAVSILQNKDVSISEIALRLNYSSVSNFTLAFKKKYGLTPSDYRAIK